LPAYQIYLSRQAEKYIKELDKKQGKRIIQTITDLKNHPFYTIRHDTAKLKGRKDYYRIRVGALRIIYKIFEEEKEIYIEKIDTRGKVYK
jgi:mRNA interferase RelE/StbE